MQQSGGLVLINRLDNAAKDSLQDMMKALFPSGYYADYDWADGLDGKEHARRLSEQIELAVGRGMLLRPHFQNSFTVAFCMPVSSLTGDVADAIGEFTDTMAANYAGLNRPIRYLFALTYKNAQFRLNEEDNEECINAIIALNSRLMFAPGSQHQFFLLRKVALENEQMPLIAFAHYLYLVTRRGINEYKDAERARIEAEGSGIDLDSLGMVASGQNREKIFTFNLKAYDDNTAEEPLRQSQEGIDKAADPGLERLIGAIRSHIGIKPEDLETEIESFRSEFPIYPVNIHDMTKKKLFRRASSRFDSLDCMTSGEKVIRESREAFIDRVVQERTAKANLSEAVSLVTKEYHYPDITELLAALGQASHPGTPDNCPLAGEILRGEGVSDDGSPACTAYRRLIGGILGRLRDELSPLILSADRMKQEKEGEKRRAIIMKDLYGDFEGCEDCLERIADKAGFPVVGANMIQEAGSAVIVSDDYWEKLSPRGKLSIARMPSAAVFRDNVITPNKIVLLRLGIAASLGTERGNNPMEKLKDILN